MSKNVIKLPVTFEGRVVGRAEISESGEIITAELNDIDNLPQNLREIFIIGLADGLSIRPNYVPALPAIAPTCICKTILNVGYPIHCPVHGEKRPLSQEEKSQRWHQNTLPWGM